MKRRAWLNSLICISALVGCSISPYAWSIQLTTRDLSPGPIQANVPSSHSTLHSSQTTSLAKRTVEFTWQEKVDYLTKLELQTKTLHTLQKHPNKALSSYAKDSIHQNQKIITHLRAEALKTIFEKGGRSQTKTSGPESEYKLVSTSRRQRYRKDIKDTKSTKDTKTPSPSPLPRQRHKTPFLVHREPRPPPPHNARFSNARSNKVPSLRLPKTLATIKSESERGNSDSDSMPSLISVTPPHSPSHSRSDPDSPHLLPIPKAPSKKKEKGKKMKTSSQTCPSIPKMCAQLSTAIKHSPVVKGMRDIVLGTPQSAFTALIAAGVTGGVMCMEEGSMGTFASACVVCGGVWCLAVKQWVEETEKGKGKEGVKSGVRRREVVGELGMELRERRSLGHASDSWETFR